MNHEKIAEELIERFKEKALSGDKYSFVEWYPPTLESYATKCAIECCRVVLDALSELQMPPKVQEIWKWQQVKQYLESNL